MKSIIVLSLLLFTTIVFSQSSIVSGGNTSETFGEVFPSMQTFDTIVEVNLGTPIFEVPEPPKPIVKKKLTFWQKILKLFNFK